jgi:integrase
VEVILLTTRKIESIKAGPKDHISWCEKFYGLGLIVYPSGRKSFVFKKNKKRITLGPYPILSLKEAQDKAISLWANKENLSSESTPTEVFQFKDIYEEYYTKIILPKSSVATQDKFKYTVRKYILLPLAEKNLNEITLSDLRSIIEPWADHKATYNILVTYLKAIFNKAVSWEYLTTNPASKLQKVTETSVIRWLSKKERTQLLHVLQEFPNRRIADYFLFLYYTGARSGEGKSVKFSEIDFDLKVWHKPASKTKQKKASVVPLSNKALDIIRRQPQGDKIFTGLGAHQRHWRQIIKKAAIQNFRIHDLRHNFASQLVSSGVSLEAIGKLLGHSSYRTTERYAHLDTKSLSSVVNLIYSPQTKPVT